MSPVGYNKDGLYHKADPPFAVLTVNFQTKTGTIRKLQKTEQLSNIHLRQTAEGPKFTADYEFGSDKGQIEATVSTGYELQIEFTGTKVTSVDAHPTSLEDPDTADPGMAETPPKPIAIACAGDIAREFDELVDENGQQIRKWCDDIISSHPGAWWVVALGKTIADVPVTLGQGTVDALRLGEGCVEGGWGYAKDALRLLQFIPAFKALKLGREAATVGAEARAVSAEAKAFGAEAKALGAPGAVGAPKIPVPATLPPGLAGVDKMRRLGTCCWVAATQAVRIVKLNCFLTVHQLMKEAGVLDNVVIGSTNFRKLIPTFERLGVRVLNFASKFPEGAGADKVLEWVKVAPNRVILFGCEWKYLKNGQQIVSRHAMVAFNSVTHGPCIIDRTDMVVRSVSELASMYGPEIKSAILVDAVALEDATVKLVPQGGKLTPALAFTATVALGAVEASKN